MAMTHPTVDELAQALLSAAPTLDPEEQGLVVVLYRALAKGHPVAPAVIAAQTGTTEERVARALEGWPGVYRDERGDVIGFWGLALSGMPHELDTGEAVIKAWCALDPFMIVPLLDAGDVRVRSADPVTGEPVTLTVGSDGVREILPSTAVVSMLEPNGKFDHDIAERFCHYVWFFGSRKSGSRWTAEHPGTFLLSIEEADAVARRSWPELVRGALAT